MKMTTELEQQRTRWRRWLGNKTRIGYSHWTTLLEADWLDWVAGVFIDCGLGKHGITFTSHQLLIKAAYRKAINHATLKHFKRLDSIYAEQKWLTRR